MSNASTTKWERCFPSTATCDDRGLEFDGTIVAWDDIVRLGWVVIMGLPSADRDYLVVVDRAHRHWWIGTVELTATLTELLPDDFGRLEDGVRTLPWQSVPESDLIQNTVIWPPGERGRALYRVVKE